MKTNKSDNKPKAPVSKEWFRTSEKFRGRKGEAIVKGGQRNFNLDFIPCTEALPPIGMTVLVALANNSTKRFKVAVAVRTGLQLFDTDEGRWSVYHDQEDGFGRGGIMAWHPMPTPKVITCPDYK